MESGYVFPVQEVGTMEIEMARLAGLLKIEADQIQTACEVATRTGVDASDWIGARITNIVSLSAMMLAMVEREEDEDSSEFSDGEELHVVN